MMLGGMSGGGMGFFFDPEIQNQARTWLLETLVSIKRSLEQRLPFAMDPVVYDFRINDRGSWSEMLHGSQAAMPDGYYSILAPKLIRKEVKELSAQSKRDLMRLNETCSQDGERARKLLDRILPQATSNSDHQQSLREVLEEHGFDREQHEQIRAEILAGRIGLAENRLPIQTDIRDVTDKDYVDLRSGSTVSAGSITSGEKALRDGHVGVVTLAAGVGSRWTVLSFSRQAPKLCRSPSCKVSQNLASLPCSGAPCVHHRLLNSCTNRIISSEQQ
jgi:hypothetical protein